MRKLLTENELAEVPGKLPGWTVEGKALTRTVEFPDFPAAMVFVNKLAEVAEELGHHPDINIRYNKVKLLLSTHDSGGVTRKDMELAQRASELGAG